MGIAHRAVALRPSTPWVVESLFDLEAREGRWQAAEKTLAQAVKHRIIPRERARHHRGVLLYERSLAALASGDRRQSINLAGEAQALTPDLAIPAAHHARLMLQDRRTGPAAKTIERSWRAAPHPELVQAYCEIHDGQTPLARFKSFGVLVAQQPAARESHLALAEAALDAQLWGEARRHLEEALTAPAPPMAKPPRPAPLSQQRVAAFDGAGLAGPTPRLCLMMARLEEAEHGAGEGMREWLDRAVTAMPDPRYVCASCGGESLQWRSLCPHCGAFDRMAWRTPVWSAPVATLPTTAETSASEMRQLPVENATNG